jgi:kynurenine formamidase
LTRYVDLTRVIEDNQPVYPGDDQTRLHRSRVLSKDGYNNHRLEISMHSGTHIDGPMHLTQSNLYVDQIEIDRLIGKGILLDVRGETEITIKPQYEEAISEDSVVLFWTGRDSLFGSEDYFLKNPYLTSDLAEFLVKRKTRMVGFDSSSPDRYPYDIHRILFRGGCFIAENLTGLENLSDSKELEIFAIPLKIHADSSIARIFAAVKQGGDP